MIRVQPTIIHWSFHLIIRDAPTTTHGIQLKFVLFYWTFQKQHQRWIRNRSRWTREKKRRRLFKLCSDQPLLRRPYPGKHKSGSISRSTVGCSGWPWTCQHRTPRSGIPGANGWSCRFRRSTKTSNSINQKKLEKKSKNAQWRHPSKFNDDPINQSIKVWHHSRMQPNQSINRTNAIGRAACHCYLVKLEDWKLDLLPFMRNLLGCGVVLLLSFLAAAAESENKVKGGLLLNVIIRQSPAVLQLLAREDQTLLIRGNSCTQGKEETFWLHGKRTGPVPEQNPHPKKPTPKNGDNLLQQEIAILDALFPRCVSITFLVLDLCLDILDSVRCLDL